MRSWPSRPPARARIELIPMIDVMLFLLVFFVLISSNVLPALGLRVALPQAGAPEHLQVLRHVTITLASDGRLSLDGVAVGPAGLGPRLAALKQAPPVPAIIIAADKGAPVSALVGVLDQLKAADVSAASIITKQVP